MFFITLYVHTKKNFKFNFALSLLDSRFSGFIHENLLRALPSSLIELIK